MVVLRWVGSWLYLAALIAFAVDMTRSFAAASLVITSLGQQWFDLAPASLAAAEASLGSSVHPFLWSPLITSILHIPTFLALAGIGAGLLYLARKRSKVDVFIN